MTILGTYWCEKNKSWIRFIAENKVVNAVMAQQSAVNPRITTDWQPANNDSWYLSYSDHYPHLNQQFFSLKNGVLYRTEGAINKLTGVLETMVFNGEHWVRNVHDTTPFDNYSSENYEDVNNRTLYADLPLTPEKAAEEYRAGEARIRDAQEVERLKWDEFKRQDIRLLGMQEAAEGTLFVGNEQVLNILFNELEAALLDFHCRNYENCRDYLTALKTIIEDPNCDAHKNIVTAASRTFVNQDLGLADDDNMREALLAHKKTFFFNLLREEAVYLSREFNISCSLRSPDEIAILEAEERSMLREPELDWEEPDLTVLYPMFDFSLPEGDSESNPTCVGDLPIYRATGRPVRARPLTGLTTAGQEGKFFIEKEKNPNSFANISMMLLGGFIAAVGIAAVALAFVAINTVTFGVGLGLGAAAILAGVGLFAVGAYRAVNTSSCMEPELPNNMEL